MLSFAYPTGTTSKLNHDKTLLCKQEHKYSVYKTYHPLIGIPKWLPSLPLHVQIHLLAHDQNELIYTYDLIPQHAQQLSTLFALIFVKCVPAVIRIRQQKQIRPIARQYLVGYGNRDIDGIANWLQNWKTCTCDWKNDKYNYLMESNECEMMTTMRLFDRNCVHFGNELIKFLLVDEKSAE